MPTPTYIPLSSIVLSTATASVTFTSISQAYADLILVINGGFSSSTGQASVTFNGDTTNANYDGVRMHGSGTAASGYTELNNLAQIPIYGRNSMAICTFTDYSTTNKNKRVFVQYGAGENALGLISFTWANTSAINTIDLFWTTSTFDTGTTFALYGIGA